MFIYWNISYVGIYMTFPPTEPCKQHDTTSPSPRVSYLEEKMKQEREEAERALAQQRELYETKLQEAMDMNTSNLSSSSSSEHSE